MAAEIAEIAEVITMGIAGNIKNLNARVAYLRESWL
jgi:hypothetical protein